MRNGGDFIKQLIHNDKWHVVVSHCSGSITVEACKGWIYSRPNSECVNPPTFFERLRSVTFEQKIDAAVKRVQKFCNKENLKETEAKLIASLYNLRKMV